MKKVLLLLVLFISVSQISAQKLFSKEWKEKQLGKDSISILNKQAERAQQKEKTIKATEIINPSQGITLSGNYLKKSANLQIASYGTSVIAIGCLTGGAYVDAKSDRNVLFGIGAGFGVASIVLHFKSINYKFKAGQALEFTGEKIKYTF